MRDLAIFITAFYDVVSSMVDVHEAISTLGPTHLVNWLSYMNIYPVRPCILGNSHGLKVIIISDISTLWIARGHWIYKRNAASVNSTELLHTCYYTLGKFVVANKSRVTFAEKGGGRGVCVAGAWGVANRNRLGLVRSGHGFHRASTRTFQDRT